MLHIAFHQLNYWHATSNIWGKKKKKRKSVWCIRCNNFVFHYSKPFTAQPMRLWCMSILEVNCSAHQTYAKSKLKANRFLLLNTENLINRLIKAYRQRNIFLTDIPAGRENGGKENKSSCALNFISWEKRGSFRTHTVTDSWPSKWFRSTTVSRQ